jgi:SAM-dependent methyltransferase
MASNTWAADVAAAYDTTSAAMYDQAVLTPAVDLLEELAEGGPALELAIGTGRVALPLAERGVDVHGIELSPHMVDQLRNKRGGSDVAVAIGDMASTQVTSRRNSGRFRLAYLVWNTIMNLTTQDEQIAVFRNAYQHLEPGGRFVVEVLVPQLRGLAAGANSRVFMNEPDHVGIETFDDLVGQIAHSHHWVAVDGRLVHHSAPYRYVWPSELDLMAQIAGFRLEHRWSDWTKSEFTSDSENQVAVFRRPCPSVRPLSVRAEVRDASPGRMSNDV